MFSHFLIVNDGKQVEKIISKQPHCNNYHAKTIVSNNHTLHQCNKAWKLTSPLHAFVRPDPEEPLTKSFFYWLYQLPQAKSLAQLIMTQWIISSAVDALWYFKIFWLFSPCLFSITLFACISLTPNQHFLKLT